VRFEGDVQDSIAGLARDGLLEEGVEELYEQAPAAYMSSLPDGTLVRVNETLLRWTGHDRGELIGRRRFHDLLAPGARIYFETHYAPLLEMQGSISGIAVELVGTEGRRIPVLMSSLLVRDDAGRARVVRTTAFDASDRQRYERELLRARADAEARAAAAVALAHVVEGVVLVGEDGEVQVLNPAAEAIFGVSAVAVIGRPAAAALDGWRELAARLVVASADETSPALVVPFVRGLDERWLSVAVVAAGSATVYTVRDVTSERRLDQLRSDIVTIVSHELRTPLTGVFGAAETLQARSASLSEDARASLLGMMVDQSRRLAKILDQILLASQLDNDNLETQIHSFDCTEVFDSVVRGVGEGMRHRVVVDAPGGVVVRADLDRLRQVVANLVDNALKYSHGPVRLGFEERELNARLTVADDGPGIPSADHDRVFEKFFRLDPAQRGGIGGTGLGLYVARELVQRMGGRIGFLPRERGTAVFVDVPRA
jgi:PAS domain S-box-containing protein